MASIRRIKRRVVRQAVAENEDTLRGRLPRPREGRRLRAMFTLARLLFFVGLPAALFASSYVLSSVAEDWRETRRAAVSAGSRLPPAPLFSSREMRPPAEAELIFSAPEPIDPAVLPLEIHKIVLDPGHGGSSQGTVAPVGLVEKEITLDVALRLRRLLESASYEVVMTREDDETLPLSERAEIANEARGDIFLSIHVNWIENRRVRGVETYYLGPTDDPYLTALAAQENQDSGYSLADFRSILERVYADVRQGESRELARAVQQALYESQRKVNGSVENRGVKRAPFGVLTRTEMPAILTEVSCLSNDSEARLLMRPSYRQFIAEALFTGIQSYSRSLMSQTNQIGS
ncbi:MAG: N-acetylmuramoyl-L-alanine amidase [Thermoanaerobaculia bacterium]